MGTTKKRKRLLFWGLASVIMLSLLILQVSASYIVKTLLNKNLPKHLDVKYGELNVNVFSGNIDFQKVSVQIKTKDSNIIEMSGEIDKIAIKSISYLQYLFYNDFALSEIALKAPKIQYYVSDKNRDSTSNRSIPKDLDITVKELKIQNGFLNIWQKNNDSLLLSLGSFNVKVSDIVSNGIKMSEKIPLHFTDHELEASTIAADFGPNEKISIGSIQSKASTIEVKDVRLCTKYDKKELSQRLLKEHDYIDLEVPKINIKGFAMEEVKKRVLFVSDTIIFLRPQLEIYRDKSLPDNTEQRKMYSQLLRELPFKVEVKQAVIDNAKINYQEKIKDIESVGLLSFSDLDAEIENITNREDAALTKINARANLMGQASLSLQWQFDVNSKSDEFLASGTLNNLKADKLNPFLKPNLHVRTEGAVRELYFTFKGNATHSTGDLKLKYDDFKFDVLQKNGRGINKFLSTIGNLFVNDGSESDANGFRHGIIEVERNSEKSFFNYLWINVREGIVKAMTGDGKKKE